jgi:hypothetical protein
MMAAQEKPYVVTNLGWIVNKTADVVRAHDAVHPERGDCGGIGNCFLMQTEHDAFEEVREQVEAIARAGFKVIVRQVKP